MSSKHSDTIAREQQIRESARARKAESSASIVRSRQNESKRYEIIIIAFVHILFALCIFGRLTINNGTLIQEVYNSLIYTSNETFMEIPSFLQKIR